MNLKTEEEREEYREEHQYFEEILDIVQKIDENNISPYLKNARDIKIWMEERGTTKPPSRTAKDEEERRLGRALHIIKQSLLKPYNSLKTEEEKEGYREKHPYIKEIMQIVEEIDRNNISPYLKNAIKIKRWMEERETTKPPSPSAKDEVEKRLGTALGSIRQCLIKPYNSLKTEEEREKFREENPELDEVMQIVMEIDLNGRTKKQQELARLMARDLELRGKLQESIELKMKYEQLLKEKQGEKVKEKEEKSVSEAEKLIEEREKENFEK